MDVTFRCACGVALDAEDVPPPQAELMWGWFDRAHPHGDQRSEVLEQIRAATAASILHGESDDDGSEGAE